MSGIRVSFLEDVGQIIAESSWPAPPPPFRSWRYEVVRHGSDHVLDVYERFCALRWHAIALFLERRFEEAVKVLDEAYAVARPPKRAADGWD